MLLRSGREWRHRSVCCYCRSTRDALTVDQTPMVFRSRLWLPLGILHLLREHRHISLEGYKSWIIMWSVGWPHVAAARREDGEKLMIERTCSSNVDTLGWILSKLILMISFINSRSVISFKSVVLVTYSVKTWRAITWPVDSAMIESRKRAKSCRRLVELAMVWLSNAA